MHRPPAVLLHFKSFDNKVLIFPESYTDAAVHRLPPTLLTSGGCRLKKHRLIFFFTFFSNGAMISFNFESNGRETLWLTAFQAIRRRVRFDCGAARRAAERRN
ncbi:MAG: hypothetical protein JSS81_06315 [Acidobacteria bacterium]|nr:hypothetical protein [Acidobacteriota bacterium]